MIELRLLHGDRDEMGDLQGVIEEAPSFAELITGSPPGPADAQSNFTALPDGKSYDDKFVFGIYRDGRMVGCADVIRGFPRARVAYIGLLLISEPHQRQGIGRAALGLIEAEARGWGCDRLRLNVQRLNVAALAFWETMGFAPTGEVKPYRYGPVESESVLFEKSL